MSRDRGRPLSVVLALLLLGTVGPVRAQESGGSGYLALYQAIEDAERALADKIRGEEVIAAADVESLAELAERARLSLFGDLIDRSALLLMIAEERLAQQRLVQSRELRIEEVMKSRELESRAAKARRNSTAALWSTLGTSAVSFVAAFAFWYLSEWQDEQYFNAATVDDAIKHRTYFKLFSLASCVSAGVGVVSAGVTIPLLARRQRTP